MDLASLNPRTFVAKHLLADEDEDELARRPAAPQQRMSSPPLAAGEPAPWDPDAT